MAAWHTSTGHELATGTPIELEAPTSAPMFSGIRVRRCVRLGCGCDRECNAPAVQVCRCPKGCVPVHVADLVSQGWRWRPFTPPVSTEKREDLGREQ